MIESIWQHLEDRPGAADWWEALEQYELPLQAKVGTGL